MCSEIHSTLNRLRCNGFIEDEYVVVAAFIDLLKHLAIFALLSVFCVSFYFKHVAEERVY